MAATPAVELVGELDGAIARALLVAPRAASLGSVGTPQTRSRPPRPPRPTPTLNSWRARAAGALSDAEADTRREALADAHLSARARTRLAGTLHSWSVGVTVAEYERRSLGERARLQQLRRAWAVSYTHLTLPTKRIV